MQLFHPVKSADNKIRKICIQLEDFKKNIVEVLVDYMPENEIKCTTQDIQTYVNTLNVSEECHKKLIKITQLEAFSYFGTIVKRWCILYNEKTTKKRLAQYLLEN